MELAQQILLALSVLVAMVLGIGLLAICGLAAVMGGMVYGGLALARFMEPSHEYSATARALIEPVLEELTT